MTQAGWYPDPAGQPQTYRYWDGTSWSQDTSGDPYAPPPGPPAPAGPPPPPAWSPSEQPPTVVTGGGAPPSSYGPTPGYGAVTPPPSGGYGQQPPVGGGFPPAPPSGGSRGSGLTILLVVAAVLVLAGLSVGGFFGYRALAGDDDSDTDASDASSATESGTTAPTDPSTSAGTSPTDPTTPTETSTTDTTVTDQQCRGGVPTPSVDPAPDAQEVSGGALTIPVPRGYAADTSYASAFTFADDFVPLQKVIEQVDDDSGWVSIYGVGGLRKANGFDDPAQAAEVVMTCMSQSPSLYNYFSGRTDLSSGEITVDGTAAYQITSELRVDDPDLTVEGDVAQVVVVDMADPDMFGLYITVVPIGDQKLIRQQEAAVDRITVD